MTLKINRVHAVVKTNVSAKFPQAKAHGTRPKFSAQVSGTRNLGGVGQWSIRHQELWCTWLKCSAAIGRRDLHTHDTSYMQSIVCK